MTQILHWLFAFNVIVVDRVLVFMGVSILGLSLVCKLLIYFLWIIDLFSFMGFQGEDFHEPHIFKLNVSKGQKLAH